MCCHETETLELPPQVIEALAHYRRLLGDQKWDWGGEQLPEFFRAARFRLLAPVIETFAATGDWSAAVRSVIGAGVPDGTVVITVDQGVASAPPSDRPAPPSPAALCPSTSSSTRPPMPISP